MREIEVLREGIPITITFMFNLISQKNNIFGHKLLRCYVHEVGGGQNKHNQNLLGGYSWGKFLENIQK